MNACSPPVRVADPWAALEEFIADYEARTGKPFRDPEPTPEELEKARAKVEDAMRGLTRLYLTDAEKRSVGL
jgi:hypothetical protein